MTEQVLFVQGGGQGAYEEDRKLVESLQEVLGAAYHVQYPQMPNEDQPEYAAWKRHITEEIAALGGKVILVGHSLGASILLKVLAEETVKKPLVGLFLIAPPYWGAEDWQVSEYELPEDFAARLPALPLFFYHSRDDEWVPFEHLALYAEKLPQATIREFESRGHQFNNDLSEVARDI